MQRIIVKLDDEKMLTDIKNALKCLGIEYDYKDSIIDFYAPVEPLTNCVFCEDGIVLLKNIVNRAKYEYNVDEEN